jgi:Mn-dependent DtxR family transcriptional regulator
MTTAERRLENIQTFQRCNSRQRQQDLADRLKLIKNYVAEYNSRLLDGESKITIVEMSEQISRKG